MKNDYKKIAKYAVGEPQPQFSEKVLLLVGAIGSGKTTLISEIIVNYIYGVQWKSDFQFKLIVEEAQETSLSQTNWITAYTLYHMEGSRLDYSLIIIETPGFGESTAQGIERDKNIVEQIKDFY